MRTSFQRSPFPRAARLTPAAIALAFLALSSAPSPAQSARYEQNLMRLAEILGAMHHLQQLCKAHDDQTWRKQMIVLMKAEGARGVKHTRLVSSFNQGYRKAQEVHTSCSKPANSEIASYTDEGARLTNWLAENRH